MAESDPASESVACAVNSPCINAISAEVCAAVGVAVPCAWVATASIACCVRSALRLAAKVPASVSGWTVSRVSHITLLRNVTPVAGSGRR